MRWGGAPSIRSIFIADVTAIEVQHSSRCIMNFNPFRLRVIQTIVRIIHDLRDDQLADFGIADHPHRCILTAVLTADETVVAVHIGLTFRDDYVFTVISNTSLVFTTVTIGLAHSGCEFRTVWVGSTRGSSMFGLIEIDGVSAAPANPFVIGTYLGIRTADERCLPSIGIRSPIVIGNPVEFAISANEKDDIASISEAKFKQRIKVKAPIDHLISTSTQQQESICRDRQIRKYGLPCQGIETDLVDDKTPAKCEVGIRRVVEFDPFGEVIFKAPVWIIEQFGNDDFAGIQLGHHATANARCTARSTFSTGTAHASDTARSTFSTGTARSS